MANTSFFKNDGLTTALQTNLNDKADDAEKLAINPEDDQFTLSDGTTTGYSALHHKEKAIDAQQASEAAQVASRQHVTYRRLIAILPKTTKTMQRLRKVAAEAAKVAAETAETNAENSRNQRTSI